MSLTKKFTLLCADGSEHSERAFKWYFETAHHEGDEIGIVHVHCLPTLPGFGGDIIATDLYSQMINQSIEDSKAVMEKFKELCEGKGVTPKAFLVSMNESVGNTVCTVAKENNVTLIVSGQRGLGAFRRAIFGSVSDYILHHSEVPVVIVPPPIGHKKKE